MIPESILTLNYLIGQKVVSNSEKGIAASLKPQVCIGWTLTPCLAASYVVPDTADSRWGWPHPHDILFVRRMGR